MKRDKVFIVIASSLIVLLSIGTFARGKKEVSITENRSLKYFPKLSSESLLDCSFQTEIEDALVDQILMGERFKSKYNSLKNKNLNIVVDTLKIFKSEPQDLEEKDKKNSDEEVIVDNTYPEDFEFSLEIIPRGENIFEIEQSNHLIFLKRDIEILKPLLKLKADNYNKLVENYPDISFHSNYIEIDEDIDFTNGEINHELIKYFHSQLDPSIKKSALYLNHPSQFQKYFYKTDHHWNAEGQIEGYKGIMRNLKGKDEELLDIEVIPIEGIKYNGYKSRRIDSYKIYDEFEIVTAKLPDYKTYINGKEKDYGAKKDFIEGNFKREKGGNYYGDANGGDFGVVKYEFNNEKEKNLLVFIDSFSNPIKELVASHYNNTYYIDFRDYENAYGKKFDFGDFVKENDIDQVLFSGYIASYANDLFLVTD